MSWLILCAIWQVIILWYLWKSGWLFPSAEPTRAALALEYFGWQGFESALKECNEAHLPGDCVLCGAS